MWWQASSFAAGGAAAKDHACIHSCCCGHSVSEPINAIAASAFPHVRVTPRRPLPGWRLFLCFSSGGRQSARRPPQGPSCGLHLYYSPRTPAGGSVLKAPPFPDILPGPGSALFAGLPSENSLRLECRPSGAPLMLSGLLFGVRSPRPVTSLSAPTGSASRELRFAQYPALRRPSPRFVRASCELTALASYAASRPPLLSAPHCRALFP